MNSGNLGEGSGAEPFQMILIWSIIIWLCLTRTGNYQIHKFDWLKWILTTVYIFLFSASRSVMFWSEKLQIFRNSEYHLKSCDKLSCTVNWRLKMWMDWNNRHHKNVCFKQNLFKKPLRKARNFIEFHLFTCITFAQYCSWKPFPIWETPGVYLQGHHCQ